MVLASPGRRPLPGESLEVQPRAGIIVPNFERGRILQLRGAAETLWKQNDPLEVTGSTHRFLAFHVERRLELPLPAGLKAEFLD